MKTRLAASITTLGFLVAACSTSMTDESTSEETEQTQEALTKVDRLGDRLGDRSGDLLGTIGTIGTSAPASTQRKSPKVTSRSANGTSVSLKLDRAVASDEIPLSSVQVYVIRKSGAGFAKVNVAQSAALSADKKTLNITLREPVKAGEIYHARSIWNPCAGTTAGVNCASRPAKYGELIGRSRRTWPFDPGQIDTSNLSVSMARTAPVGNPAIGAFGQQAVLMQVDAPAPPNTAFVVDEPLAAPAAASTFKVASATPAVDSVNVDRTTNRIYVNFTGGTIDCAATSHGKDGFRLHSVDADVVYQQDMYEDPLAPTSNTSAATYRGNLRCEADTNRLVFTPPGPLLGGTYFQIELNVHSVEGDFLQGKILEFQTATPGLQVLAQRVENWYGGDETCDNDWLSSNYCDIYITSAIATATKNEASRIPEQGDFSDMKLYTADSVSGSRNLWPEKVLFANPNPVTNVLDMNMYAHDKDSDSAWLAIFNTVGDIAAQAGAALIATQPAYGAIAEGVAAGAHGIAKAIGTNEDDFLGSQRWVLTRNDARWGTQSSYPMVMELSKGAPNRGPVKVYVRSEELPRSWMPPAPIL